MPFRDPIDAVREKFPFLTDDDVGEVLGICSTREIGANEYFLRAGKVELRGAIVLHGLMRNFHTLPDGTERTVLFIPELRTIAPYATLFSGLPATESTMTLEDTVLLEIDLRALRRQIDQNPRLMRAYTSAVELALTDTISRIDQFILLTAEERYQRFVKENPGLSQRIPLKHLASYLGITPVSLSRIRARG